MHLLLLHVQLCAIYTLHGRHQTPAVPILILLLLLRMCAYISVCMAALLILPRLIRAPIYPSLRDHPSVAAYPAVRGMAQPLFMLDHSVPEGGQGADDSRSKFNCHEVDLAVGLAR